MNYLSYLIISSACLGISYLLFRLLRNEIWFLQQRIFLISSVILSFSLPLTHIKVTFPESLSAITAYNQSQVSAYNLHLPTSLPDSVKIMDLAMIIYLCITVVFILIIIFQLLKITWLYINSAKTDLGNLIVLRSDRITIPFSFFKWIFLPSALKDDEETNSILIHESIHASQFHSADNIIFSFGCALLWFNPFIWLMRRSVHLVHEYLADEGTLKKGMAKSRYQALLVNHAAEMKLITIPSGFNNNLLKKRMIMMTRTNMKETRRVKILSIIPLPLALILTTALLYGLFPANLNAQENQTKKDPLKEVMIVGYGTQKQSTPDSGKDTINYIVDGVSVNSIKDLDPNSIESVNVLKTDRTVIIRTKDFANKNKTEKATVPEAKPSSDNTLYMLDGKRISKADLDKIPAETIDNVDVRRDEAAKDKYGAGDFDGVVVVTTKKK